MDICHQQFRASNQFTMLLLLDGTNGDFAAFVHIETVGLSSVHLGMG